MLVAGLEAHPTLTPRHVIMHRGKGTSAFADARSPPNRLKNECKVLAGERCTGYRPYLHDKASDGPVSCAGADPTVQKRGDVMQDRYEILGTHTCESKRAAARYCALGRSHSLKLKIGHARST